MLTLLCLPLSAIAATSPAQAWAHKSGVVKLKANGPKLASQELRDRLLIHEAFARWGVAYDEARLDVVRTLFTPDAVFEVTLGSAEPIARAVGPDEIVQNVSGSLQQQADQRRHALSNIVIDELSRSAAKAIAYGIVTVAADGLKIGATVIYSADLRKEADGVWRFSRFVIGMDDYAGRRIVNPPKP
jgi:ketosteroid isomerase-like protein